MAARAAKLFPEVVIAVAHSDAKGPMFSSEERKQIILEAVGSLPGDLLSRFEVITFGGLLVDCAREVGAGVMIRGLRAVSDFEFEFQMALMNRHLSSDLEVVFLMPDVHNTYLTSSLVKEVARLGGDVSALVPESSMRRLGEKLGRASDAARGSRERRQGAGSPAGTPRGRGSEDDPGRGTAAPGPARKRLHRG